MVARLGAWDAAGLTRYRDGGGSLDLEGRSEQSAVDLERSRNVDSWLREIGVQGIDEIVGFLGNDDGGHLHQSGFAGIQPSLADFPQLQGWRRAPPIVRQIGNRDGGHRAILRDIDGNDSMRRHHGWIDMHEGLEHREGDGGGRMDDAVASGRPPSPDSARTFPGKCGVDVSRRGETIDAHGAI